MNRPPDLASIAREITERSRAAQELPARVDDRATVARLAALLRVPEPPKRARRPKAA